MADFGLKGKIVLITGGNHGIGAATAAAFAAEGARVLINYLGDPPVHPVLAEIRHGGGHVAAWEADLADPGTIPRLFDLAEQILGPVDILVNNAAHAELDTFLPADLARRDSFARPTVPITSFSHDRHFAVNSRAPALLMAEYARRCITRRAEWGRIICVSTDAAPGGAAEVSYWASKNALESYSRSAAVELARHGITVNIVAPGPIQTGWIPADHVPAVAAEIPLGRVGQPDDVADVIVFLASHQARWLTGQTLFVGGGYRMY